METDVLLGILLIAIGVLLIINSFIKQYLNQNLLVPLLAVLKGKSEKEESRGKSSLRHRGEKIHQGQENTLEKG